MSGPKVWPRELPAHVRGNPLLRAETKVYDALRAQLSPAWTVFYSRPWLGMTPTGRERDGEADFVIVHPSHGFLTIEVKGGGIDYDPAKNAWTSTDSHGIVHPIQDPFAQAMKSKHALLGKLNARRDWPAKRFIRARHGVVFPDAEAPPGALGASMPAELICCRPKMKQLGAWVLDRLTGGDEDEIGRDGLPVFERLLAMPFTLRVPLGHVLDDHDEAIEVLTPEQFHILDAIGQLRRVAVGGGAGTGKTIVAMEDAVRIAAEGVRSLFVCLSEPLAGAVAAKLRDTGVEVRSFPDLCQTYARLAGQPVEEFSETRAAQRLADAARALPDFAYDAIIVDEAQDFRSEWWLALDAMLGKAGQARLHAFYDSNQSLYGDMSKELTGFDMIPIHLGRNLRNTRAIHNVASKFYRGLPVRSEGPEGVSVLWCACEESAIAATAAQAVRNLLGEAIEPGDIAVLTPSANEIAPLRGALAAALARGLTLETIGRFKGLERRVVVLAASRTIADERELAYVGMSRARAHLAVIGNRHILHWLQGQDEPLT